MGLPNLDKTAHVRGERRLHDEQLVWITTVRVDGQPQASPFMWEGTRFLILSQPCAVKVPNLRRNPEVALHLDVDHSADDGGVLTAQVEPGPLGEPDRSASVAKYHEAMSSEGLTPEQALADFSTGIRITPTRARSY